MNIDDAEQAELTTKIPLLERLKNVGGYTIGEVVLEIETLNTEVQRLKEKCDKQAMILRRLSPENFSDTLFISGILGEKDSNGLPEYVEICPAYGVDWVQVYEKTDKIIGGMGS